MNVADLNNDRCRICPMLYPGCFTDPCAMFGRPVLQHERDNPQEMFRTLEKAEKEKARI